MPKTNQFNWQDALWQSLLPQLHGTWPIQQQWIDQTRGPWQGPQQAPRGITRDPNAPQYSPQMDLTSLLPDQEMPFQGPTWQAPGQQQRPTMPQFSPTPMNLGQFPQQQQPQMDPRRMGKSFLIGALLSALGGGQGLAGFTQGFAGGTQQETERLRQMAMDEWYRAMQQRSEQRQMQEAGREDEWRQYQTGPLASWKEQTGAIDDANQAAMQQAWWRFQQDYDEWQRQNRPEDETTPSQMMSMLAGAGLMSTGYGVPPSALPDQVKQNLGPGLDWLQAWHNQTYGTPGGVPNPPTQVIGPGGTIQTLPTRMPGADVSESTSRYIQGEEARYNTKIPVTLRDGTTKMMTPAQAGLYYSLQGAEGRREIIINNPMPRGGGAGPSAGPSESEREKAALRHSQRNETLYNSKKLDDLPPEKRQASFDWMYNHGIPRLVGPTNWNNMAVTFGLLPKPKKAGKESAPVYDEQGRPVNPKI